MSDCSDEQVLASLSVGPAEEAVIVADAEGAVRYGTRAARKSRSKRSAEPRMRWRSGTGPWITYVPAGTLLTGDMLRGSTQVEVRTPVAPDEVVVAGGVYMTLVRDHVLQRDAFVVFRDDQDRIIPCPVADELKREPVTDTDVPCRACGKVTWDAVEVRSRPTSSRYRQRGLVCGTCGHQWGGWTDTGRRRPGVKNDREQRDRRGLKDELDSDAEIVRRAQFQVYGLSPELASSRCVSKSGGENSTITTVEISHDVGVGKHPVEICVSSAASPDHGRRDDVSRAAGALAGQLWADLIELGRDDGLFALSREARSLRLEELRSEAHDRAARAGRRQVEMSVDDKRVQFALVCEESGRWCASAVLRDVAVTVASDTLEPAAVHLVGIKDPDSFFSTQRRGRGSDSAGHGKLPRHS
jgi:hypothetical protein